MDNDPYRAAAEALRNARCAVAVTGAGISAASGIPTFRGDSGIWRKYPPEEYATIEAFLADPAKVWKFWLELARDFRGCRPNAAHDAVARLETAGRLAAVITQNIDGLHQEAGSRHVVEYHGNARALLCMDCGTRRPLDLDAVGADLPRCTACRGIMKPDIVMFGEMIPPEAMIEADRLTQRCDVVLIAGTSAQVYPAAGIPYEAKRRRAFIIEANIEPTDFTTTITDAFLEGPAEETLPRLADALP